MKSTKTKRNETKSTKTKSTKTKRNEINEMKTKPTKAKRNQRKQNDARLLPTHVSVSFIRRGQDLITIEQEYYAFIQQESVLFT
jgi:hypothetical protein